MKIQEKKKKLKVAKKIIESCNVIDKQLAKESKILNIEPGSIADTFVRLSMLNAKGIIISEMLRRNGYSLKEKQKPKSYYKHTSEFKCCGKILVGENVGGIDHSNKCWYYVCPKCKKQFYLYDYTEYKE